MQFRNVNVKLFTKLKFKEVVIAKIDAKKTLLH